ncbi:SDR family oxidoreductase [Rhodococcus triatomae]|nr:NAD-dependent epimerase/dehydratase [Rhodococcus triatomae BKS 15-14]
MGTYVLTGSASGIGAATKARLESDGHRVIGVDIRDADVIADLRSPQGRAQAVAEVTALAGDSLDGFVPFAGLAPAAGRPAADVIELNYFGAVELLEGLRPLLAAGDGASVVLISSNSTTTSPGWPVEAAEACLAGDGRKAAEITSEFGDLASVHAYPVSKAAVAWYARTKSAEYIRDGIRLNAVAPGIIETPMTVVGREDPLVGEAMKGFVGAVPAGRGGKPEEVAALVAFLLGPESTYVVGSVLFVDGGIDAAFRGKDWPAVWQVG